MYVYVCNVYIFYNNIFIYVCCLLVHCTCLLCIDMCIVHNVHVLVCVSTYYVICMSVIFKTIHVCVRISLYIYKLLYNLISLFLHLFLIKKFGLLDSLI